jgi:hypothetical protein
MQLVGNCGVYIGNDRKEECFVQWWTVLLAESLLRVSEFEEPDNGAHTSISSPLSFISDQTPRYCVIRLGW